MARRPGPVFSRAAEAEIDEMTGRNRNITTTSSASVIARMEAGGPQFTQPGSGVRIGQEKFSQTLFDQEESKDLTIIVKDGKRVKCHRIIFSAQSPELAAKLSTEKGMRQSKSGRSAELDMPENSEDGMKLLIRYLYGFEITKTGLSCGVAVELFKVANHFQLPKLRKFLEQVLVGLGQGMEWYKPDDLLEVYFEVMVDPLEKFRALRNGVLRILSRMREQLRSCARYQRMSSDEIQTLLFKLLDAQESGEGDVGKKRKMEADF